MMFWTTLVVGALVMLLGFLVSSFIADMRHMKSLIRHQQDELRQLKMQFGDVVAQGQIRDFKRLQKLREMKGLPSELSKEQFLAEQPVLTRPGEVDQELLLR